MTETYKGTLATSGERDNHVFHNLEYGYDDATYFDELDEVLHDELVYLEVGEVLVLTIKRIL